MPPEMGRCDGNERERQARLKLAKCLERRAAELQNLCNALVA